MSGPFAFYYFGAASSRDVQPLAILKKVNGINHLRASFLDSMTYGQDGEETV
jgi:hypothetical protein